MFKIFTENGDNIGNGHVSRCLLLYNEIIKRGYEAIIYLNKEGNGNMLSSVRYKIVDWHNIDIVKNLVKKDYVIVDSYLANIDVLKYISGNSKQVLFFDDYDRVEYPQGLIVCPTAEKIGKNYICGEKYILVKDGFYGLLKKNDNQEIKNIFLSIGTDVNNCLDRVVEAVLSETKDVIVHVVNKEKIKYDRVKTYYHIDEFEMANLINFCDFSIISCGQTLMENLVVGNPFLALITADNQIRNYNFIKNKNLVDYKLDVRDENFFDNFKSVLKNKINNFKQSINDFNLKSSCNAAKNIIDELIKEK